MSYEEKCFKVKHFLVKPEVSRKTRVENNFPFKIKIFLLISLNALLKLFVFNHLLPYLFLPILIDLNRFVFEFSIFWGAWFEYWLKINVTKVVGDVFNFFNFMLFTQGVDLINKNKIVVKVDFSVFPQNEAKVERLSIIIDVYKWKHLFYLHLGH